MLDKTTITKIVNEAIEDTDSFLVEIKATNDNKIFVYIDGFEGMPIDECVRVSRFIESKLDRDQEDFELQVSSPGLDQPFKVIEQYEKHKGEEVRVILKDGTTFEGKITEVKENEIVLQYEETYKEPGKKKKEKKINNEAISLEHIASAKTIIRF
ncbi:MAG TPA: ribosome assembly cofactor RimP [Salinivirga sp.]|uniref:Ribosome maturation factor RimP n=1 Tax=Salinivirga cyanobacteriivorans TaxID=1307839 RepID=A0A0S2HZW5_9BACT|nr:MULTISPECIES: ribosome assembly cofactor RimP [Salinivirga]ALO15569.1 Ribosome maturation factor RimP [Salinivirga cyanobacteriivorans]HKK57990.1 ribosome assembly cofactor RimP [Salinivirga sp.]